MICADKEKGVVVEGDNDEIIEDYFQIISETYEDKKLYLLYLQALAAHRNCVDFIGEFENH